MNLLDFTGAGLSLASTYYFTQVKRLAWLVGLGAILLNSVLYWQKGIYGHLFLEIVYSFSMIYGWFQWSSGRGISPERKIRALTFHEGFIYGLLALVLIWIFGLVLSNLTDSSIPFWDATSTVLSLLAQWMLCLKIIHCWILWFIVDVMIACIQYYKGIPCHSVVHWIYLGMAVVGYYRWKKLV